MSEHGSWLKLISDTPTSERNILLTSLVSSVFKTKLQMTDDDILEIDKSYFELGLTSLGAVELQEELEQKINSRIDATVLYNNPTVEYLVTHLRNLVLTDYFLTHGAVQTITDNSGKDLNNSSEYSSDAKSMLDEMLNDI